LLPTNLPEISPQNANRLQEVAQWGDGLIFYTDFLSDGSKFYSVSTSGLRVYDSESLEILVHINEEIYDQRQVVWTISPDEDWFALLNHDFVLKIWSLTTGKLKHSDSFDKNYLGCIDSVSFSPNSSKLAIFGECNLRQQHGRLTIIDIESGQEVMHEEGRGMGVFTPDGDLITFPTFGNDPPVSFWSAPNYKFISNLSDSDRVICSRTYYQQDDNPWPSHIDLKNDEDCLSFSPDGSNFALGMEYGVNIYESATREKIFTFPPGRVEFMKDGRFLILDNGRYQDKVYELSNWDALSFVPNLGDVALSSDNTRLIGKRRVMIGERQYRISDIVLYSVPDETRLVVFDGYNQAFFSPDGTYLALYTDQYQTYQNPIIVNSVDGSILLTMENEKYPIISQNNRYATTESSKGTIIYDLVSGTRTAFVNGIWPQFIPDGKYLLTIDAGTIYRWSVEDGELLASAEFLITTFDLTADYDGEFFVEESTTGVRVINQKSLHVMHTFPSGAVVAPSNEAIAYNDGTTIEVYQVATNDLLFSFSANQIGLLCFSNDGSLLAAVRSGRSIDIYNVENGRKENTLIADGDVKNVVFSPDNLRLYAHAEPSVSLGKGSISGWILESGQSVVFRSFYCFEDFASSISYQGGSLALSPDGGFLAYTSDDCSTTVIELSKLGNFPAIQDWGDLLAISPNGEIIAITSKSGGIRLWDVVTGELIKTIVDNKEDYKRYQNMVNMIGGSTPKGQWGISLSFSPDGRFLVRTADGVVTLWGIKP